MGKRIVAKAISTAILFNHAQCTTADRSAIAQELAKAYQGLVLEHKKI
jgi:hypothetical protein